MHVGFKAHKQHDHTFMAGLLVLHISKKEKKKVRYWNCELINFSSHI